MKFDDDIKKWSKARLRAYLTRKVKTANSRLRNLRKSGYYNYNANISQKWDLWLKKQGTKSGYFKQPSKNATISELRTQAKAVRSFLASKTSTRDTKYGIHKGINRFKNNYGVEITENEYMEILTLYGESGLKDIIQSSDQLMLDILEDIRSGKSRIDIKTKLAELQEKGRHLKYSTRAEVINEYIKDEMRKGTPYEDIVYNFKHDKKTKERIDKETMDKMAEEQDFLYQQFFNKGYHD